MEENDLRWDSLGGFLSLAASFASLATRTGNQRVQLLADTLDRAMGTLLREERSPGRRVGGLNNRGSHSYLADDWAQELADQSTDREIAGEFAELAKLLVEQEQTNVRELTEVEDSPADSGGYYRPDPMQAALVMRPSQTFNGAIATLD